MVRVSNLLLTGVPGVGKTTLVRKVAAEIHDLTLRGFTTEEIRTRGRRAGFAIATFDGERATLAHVDFPSRKRVGRYGVDVAALDAIAGTVLTPTEPPHVYLIDEIGKMECFSSRFVETTRALLDGTIPVIATIAKKGPGFIEECKNRSDVELWEIHSRDRDRRVAEVVEWIRSPVGPA